MRRGVCDAQDVPVKKWLIGSIRRMLQCGELLAFRRIERILFVEIAGLRNDLRGELLSWHARSARALLWVASHAGGRTCERSSPMPYGMYISAEGAAAQAQRLEVIANNMANVDTAGFKQDVPSSRRGLPRRFKKARPSRATARSTTSAAA